MLRCCLLLETSRGMCSDSLLDLSAVVFFIDTPIAVSFLILSCFKLSPPFVVYVLCVFFPPLFLCTSPQPQTSEHLAAVEIMKLKHIIILQNKIDLVKESAAHDQYKQILKFIKGRYCVRVRGVCLCLYVGSCHRCCCCRRHMDGVVLVMLFQVLWLRELPSSPFLHNSNTTSM